MENTLGKRIVQNRKRLGLTQDQLAEQLGVTAQAVSKWENDQSCPDISTLPRLAEIFGITTDELLGREAPPPVYIGTVETPEEESGVGGDSDKWVFKFDGGRKNALCFALTVLTVGILYLLSNLMDWSASFWEILWPTVLLIYGIFGIYPKFSFLRTGCAILGGYFLLINLNLLPFGFGGDLVWPAIIIIVGLGLLADAMKKPRKATVQFKGKSDKRKENMNADDHSFDYSASFGESEQFIEMPCLHAGTVSTSFGSYKIDLSGVCAVSEDCTLDIKCAFGELVILVPQRFSIRPASSTAFAEISVSGTPAPESEGAIYVNASASFGEISLRYI